MTIQSSALPAISARIQIKYKLRDLSVFGVVLRYGHVWITTLKWYCKDSELLDDTRTFKCETCLVSKSLPAKEVQF